MIKVFAAPIAASSRVIPCAGGMADTGPWAISLLIQIHLEFPWGCNLLVLDGDSVNIVVVHNLEGGLLMLTIDLSLEGFYPQKALVYPISDLTTGSGFDHSLLR
jgi:hypothetical protein